MPYQHPSPFKTNHQASYPAISPKQPALSTKGKSAVVTGGGSGIGAAIAQSLAQSGVSNLALLGRTEATLAATKASIEAESGSATKVFTYVIDLTAPQEVIDRALSSFASSATGGKIDILVANAGYMADAESIADADEADWWAGFELNVLGNFRLLRAFGPLASPEGAGVIHITTSSVHTEYLPGFSAYRASKLAAVKLFEYFLDEHPAVFGLHLQPGLVASPGVTSKFGGIIAAAGLEYDDVRLAADFVVWALGPDARFLRRRFVYANWDVGELVARRAQVEADPTLFTIGLLGWP